MILSSTYYSAKQNTNKIPLVLLHGLFGSARNLTSMAKALSATRDVVVLSLRNHGNSPHDSVMTYQQMAVDIVETLEHLSIDSIDLLGHSMGGKVAMMVALQKRMLVNKLIVVDIAPKSYSQRYGAYVQAMQAVPLDQIKRRSDADAHLKSVIPEADLRAFILQNLIFEKEPPSVRWQLNLDAIYNGMSNIENFPDIDDMSYDKRVLFIRGALSPYIQTDDITKIQQHFPHAEIETVPMSGHWPHAEQPKVFNAIVTSWLDKGET